MTDGALTAREAGALLAKIEVILTRLDDIDARLASGDKRFEDEAKERAAALAVHKFAARVGAAVLAGGGLVGGWIVSHFPTIIELFWPPKH